MTRTILESERMTKTAQKAPTPTVERGHGRTIAAVLIGGTLLLVGGAYGAGYALAGETLAPRTTIEGVAVGGLTPGEAEARLATELAPRAEAAIALVAGDHRLTKSPAELGIAPDARASVSAAGGGKSFDPRVIWENLFGGRDHDAVVTRDEAALEASAAELAQLTDTEPVNAELALEGEKPTLTEGADGRKLDVGATADAVVEAYLRATEVEAVVVQQEPDITTAEAQEALDEVVTPALSAPVTLTAGDKSFVVEPAMIAQALVFEPVDGKLATSLDPDVLMEQASKAMQGLGIDKPQDARFTFEGGRPTIVPSVDGMGVAKEELVQVVRAAMVKAGAARTGSVTIAPKQADFTTEMAQQAGVKEVTGEFTTYFPGSAYRINNIGKSAGLVNGVFLKPGETFSMNKVLGPRTIARGWQAGGAIDGGRVVERMGGGISQTTTTTFNAIFFAGLEDVYHKPHSLYFSRYPMGREATLDYNSVDLKFTNNTDYGVLMQGFTRNGPKGWEVTVRVWSTKTYDVKASQPVKSNVRQPGPPIKDNSAVCSPQGAKEGFTVNYNRLFYQGGKLVRTEPFKWTYNTLTPVECTNPAARPDRIER